MTDDDTLGLTTSELRSRVRNTIVGALDAAEVPAYAVEPVAKDYGNVDDEMADQLIAVYGDEIWLVTITRAVVKAP